MKYIRTENGIYELKDNMSIEIGVYNFFGKIHNTGKKHLFRNDKDLGEVVKEANTIEELCDGFYLDDKLLNKFNKYAVFEKDELPKVKELFICYTKSKIPFVVYAFIKTSKGLIYVAKMNEEGDLVLI